MRLLRTAGRLAAAVALAVMATSLLPTTPAHADHNNHNAFGETFVDGGDLVDDDWGDHAAEIGNLCSGCANSNNKDIVVMWQAILYAEELLNANEIDGIFGPRTRSATIALQRRYGITADGIVGNQTWSAVDNRLFHGDVVTNIYAYRALVHSNSTVTFRRGNRSIPPFEGAYQLLQVNPVNGRPQVHFNNSTHRISLVSRTLSVNVCPC